ncbi:MAG: putative signal transduction protein containing a rane domain, an and a domain [Frankiales bacterium]|nr:putative signal transduction protein containing a rane domain, an and a domain [Frankiales bacterium]
MPGARVDGLILDRSSRLRLLLIEDSASDQELVLALLEDELPHAEVHVASSLDEALRRLGETWYDVALADLSLPDAEGPTVVRAVRAAHPDTALLVLTGRGYGDLALWALAEGAQDYLVKGQYDGPRLAVALLHALQRQRAEQVAHRYLQLARGLLDALEAPTCAVVADGGIVAVNEAWRTFTLNNGGLSEACSEGTNYLKACDVVGPDAPGARDARAVADGLRGVLGGRQERFQHEYPCHGPDGERWFSVRIAPAEIDGAPGAVISHVDVTAMHAAQQLLSHQTLHDALTGLPNRLLLGDRLGQALLERDRTGCDVAVAFLDLDHFKRVNDSLGHAAGDDLLQQVARRLAADLRSSDTVCRYAGDEFVVVWRDLQSLEDVDMLSARLVEALEQPFTLEGTPVAVSASVGVVVADDTSTPEDLVQAADAAMYDAKRHGGGRVRLFSTELRRGVAEQIEVESGLRTALEQGQLELHYQPVIDLGTGRAVGVEALMRWQHPELGRIGPDRFIPVAEASGLIVPMGRWALQQACRDAVAFQGAARGLDVAVNLSVRQLAQPDVLAHVQEALQCSGLDPRRLLLEVTESAVMEDAELAAVTLDALVALGVRIAIDDFGTGYSSLLYLRRYPISALKLDRAFVSGLGASQDDEAICSSVVSLARAVGATSIGEGVETVEQYAALRAYGCEQAQGWLWSPAVPVERLEEALLTCSRVPVPALPGTCPPPRTSVEQLEPDVTVRILGLHGAGASLHTIAAALNREHRVTASGVRWTAGVVARHIAAQEQLRGLAPSTSR